MSYQQLLPFGEGVDQDSRELSNVASFVKAGRAVFTILNEKTGKRFTFKVKKHKKKNIYFVSVLAGPDNVVNYIYVGTIFGDDFRLTKRSKVSTNATSYLAFAWFWENKNRLPESVKVFHENRCGRCGRALTVPESVTNGFGPECIKKV